MTGSTTRPSTPVPPEALLTTIEEIGDVVRALVALTDAGDAWAVRALRSNVELARRRPETLRQAENQLDFIEELAAAAWDTADDGMRRPLPPGRTPAETQAREASRRALLERLVRTAGELCEVAEAWLFRDP